METLLVFVLLAAVIVIGFMIHAKFDDVLRELRGSASALCALQSSLAQILALTENVSRSVAVIENDVSAPRRRAEKTLRDFYEELNRIKPEPEPPEKFHVVRCDPGNNIEIIQKAPEYLDSWLWYLGSLRKCKYTVLAEADTIEEAEQKERSFSSGTGSEPAAEPHA